MFIVTLWLVCDFLLCYCVFKLTFIDIFRLSISSVYMNVFSAWSFSFLWAGCLEEIEISKLIINFGIEYYAKCRWWNGIKLCVWQLLGKFSCVNMWACLWDCVRVYVKKKKTIRRTKGELTVTQTKYTHIYEKDKERKNGIVDSILSGKTEHETTRYKTLCEWKGERMSSKVMFCKEDRETVAKILVDANAVLSNLCDSGSVLWWTLFLKDTEKAADICCNEDNGMHSIVNG